MTETLVDYFLQYKESALVSNGDRERFFERVRIGRLTRDENPLSHACAMCLAYDPETGKILTVLHKRANSWIFPGGHIDLGELPDETVRREAGEELGLDGKDLQLEGPFGLQILDINNPPQPCRNHYDIFFAIPVDPDKVRVDAIEFLDSAWFSLQDAMVKIQLPYYQKALRKFIEFKGIG